MVGYNEQELEQKARDLGYEGDMRYFPAFLEKNPTVAQQFLEEQNKPRFQAGGLPNPFSNSPFVPTTGIDSVTPIETRNYSQRPMNPLAEYQEMFDLAGGLPNPFSNSPSPIQNLGYPNVPNVMQQPSTQGFIPTADKTHVAGDRYEALTVQYPGFDRTGGQDPQQHHYQQHIIEQEQQQAAIDRHIATHHSQVQPEAPIIDSRPEEPRPVPPYPPRSPSGPFYTQQPFPTPQPPSPTPQPPFPTPQPPFPTPQPPFPTPQPPSPIPTTGVPTTGVPTLPDPSPVPADTIFKNFINSPIYNQLVDEINIAKANAVRAGGDARGLMDEEGNIFDKGDPKKELSFLQSPQILQNYVQPKPVSPQEIQSQRGEDLLATNIFGKKEHLGSDKHVYAVAATSTRGGRVIPNAVGNAAKFYLYPLGSQPPVGTVFPGKGQYGPQKPYAVTQEMYDMGFMGYGSHGRLMDATVPHYDPEKFKQYVLANSNNIFKKQDGKLIFGSRDRLNKDRIEQAANTIISNPNINYGELPNSIKNSIFLSISFQGMLIEQQQEVIGNQPRGPVPIRRTKQFQSGGYVPRFQSGGYVPSIQRIETPAGLRFLFNNQFYMTRAEAEAAQSAFREQLEQQQQPVEEETTPIDPDDPPAPLTSIDQGPIPDLAPGFEVTPAPQTGTIGQEPIEPIDIAEQPFSFDFLGSILEGGTTTDPETGVETQTQPFTFSEENLGQEQEDIVQGLANINFGEIAPPVFNPRTNTYSYGEETLSPKQLREKFGLAEVEDSSEPVVTNYGTFPTQAAFEEFKSYVSQQFPFGISAPSAPSIGDITADRVSTPALPEGSKFEAVMTPFEEAQLVDPATGQLTSDLSVAQAAQVAAAQTQAPTVTEAAQVTAAQAAPAVAEAGVQAAQLAGPTQTIQAAQQEGTQVSDLQAAQQAAAVQVEAPPDRALQEGEIITGPTGQAAQAAEFIEPALQAAQADPSKAATVQGQLEILSDQFSEGEVPFWAAGAIRAATQGMLSRGLGASSMAGQAIVQAALEASLPIAQADAKIIASFEAQNLSNRQQTAMLTAQYRAQFLNQEFDQAFQTRVRNAATISDIANRNFTADQQIALENAKLTQTINLANLNNKQALIMAEAAVLANLDIANLNNRQQASVQNAQNFLQIDMANLNNQQQAAVLNSQQQVQSILTDVAAENAARQINATNQQQTDQFYANLIASVGQHNTAQTNAINQFNAGEENALNRFNSELANQREQFNAKNQLAIQQSNAIWRREIATADTAALNFQNQFNAQNLLDMSNEAYDNLWQEYRDVLEFAFTAGENEADRIAGLQLAQLNIGAEKELEQLAADRQNSQNVSGFISSIISPFAQAGISALAESLFD